MLSRFVVASGLVLAILGVIHGVTVARLIYGLKRTDPHPAFMADYRLNVPGTYQKAKDDFDGFVRKTFPVGSNAKDAIAQLIHEGFQLATPTADTLRLVWNRMAGPCREEFSILIRQSDASIIAEITGRLHPVCL
jgi:hypothetical protein